MVVHQQNLQMVDGHLGAITASVIDHVAWVSNGGNENVIVPRKYYSVHAQTPKGKLSELRNFRVIEIENNPNLIYRDRVREKFELINGFELWRLYFIFL